MYSNFRHTTFAILYIVYYCLYVFFEWMGVLGIWDVYFSLKIKMIFSTILNLGFLLFWLNWFIVAIYFLQYVKLKKAFILILLFLQFMTIFLYAFTFYIGIAHRTD